MEKKPVALNLSSILEPVVEINESKEGAILLNVFIIDVFKHESDAMAFWGENRHDTFVTTVWHLATSVGRFNENKPVALTLASILESAEMNETIEGAILQNDCFRRLMVPLPSQVHVP